MTTAEKSVAAPDVLSGHDRYTGYGSMRFVWKVAEVAYAHHRPNIRFWHCDTRSPPEMGVARGGIPFPPWDAALSCHPRRLPPQAALAPAASTERWSTPGSRVTVLDLPSAHARALRRQPRTASRRRCRRRRVLRRGLTSRRSPTRMRDPADPRVASRPNRDRAASGARTAGALPRRSGRHRPVRQRRRRPVRRSRQRRGARPGVAGARRGRARSRHRPDRPRRATHRRGVPVRRRAARGRHPCARRAPAGVDVGNRRLDAGARGSHSPTSTSSRRQGMFAPAMREWLEVAVAPARRICSITGAAGTGKTTLLAALLGCGAGVGADRHDRGCRGASHAASPSRRAGGAAGEPRGRRRHRPRPAGPRGAAHASGPARGRRVPRRRGARTAGRPEHRARRRCRHAARQRSATMCPPDSRRSVRSPGWTIGRWRGRCRARSASCCTSRASPAAVRRLVARGAPALGCRRTARDRGGRRGPDDGEARFEGRRRRRRWPTALLRPGRAAAGGDPRRAGVRGVTWTPPSTRDAAATAI